MKKGESLKDLRDSVIATSGSFADYIRELRIRNGETLYQAHKRRDAHDSLEAKSWIKSGAFAAGGVLVGNVAALAGLASAFVPVPVAVGAAGLAGAGFSAALFHMGKAIYHAISAEMSRKSVIEISSKTDEQLLLDAAKDKEAVGLWGRAAAAFKFDSQQGLSEQEVAPTLRQRQEN